MNALDLIKNNEGLRLKPYLCTKRKLTWGYGRNFQDNPLNLEEMKKLFEMGPTKEFAEWLLRVEVANLYAELSKRVPEFSKLSQARQSALVDMRYQLGNGFYGFKRMLAAVAAENWVQVVAEVFDSDYAKQTPMRAKKIARLLGDYP